MSPKPAVKTTTTIVIDPRCKYLAASGRRCRTLASRDTSRTSGYSAFCLQHAQMEQQFLDAKSVSKELIGPVDDFRINMSVNEVLGNLLKLVAENRIPLRNANTLAYICQLLLTSNPGVRYETNLSGGEKYERQIINRSMEVMYGEDDDDEEAEDNEESEEQNESDQPGQEQVEQTNSFQDQVAAAVKILDGQ